MLKFTKREELILLVVVVTLLLGSGILVVNYLRRGSGMEFVANDIEEELAGKQTEDELATETEREQVEETKEQIMVQIGGAVNKPGVYQLEVDSRLFELIEEAGGPSAKADLDNVNLVKRLSDSEQIVIPEKTVEEEQREEVAVEESEREESVETEPITSTAKDTDKVDLNNASQTELEELQGVGPVTAQNIIEYRQSEGGFNKIEEIKEVSGVGEVTYQQIKDELLVR
ncbi:helix-hairpin-helix domain-containing protein [Fuchsiella alkaliacetigena]|uniref:helix-hairpin-helix domain-containing protein n=1 Tax=Fuchsiella alkaliacetigena TaxID=957042 RepID=UPI00200AF787|nr:helix-hairpin-helix domain-containing protein [Fuchsiella alkaliacetigena]MCK8825199.1 helix-hairpin-helix domain-containing protein [Fuchsiella alkaliacetigena]